MRMLNKPWKEIIDNTIEWLAFYLPNKNAKNMNGTNCHIVKFAQSYFLKKITFK
jgi:hypothetical protein